MPKKLPLLMIPGLLSDEALWRGQIKSLESLAECRVFPPVAHESMEALARGILAEAPPQFALAAISMGGYVAFEILRQAPERVLKLCLFDTTARPDTPEQSARRRLLIAMSRTGQFKGVTPRLLPTLIHPDRVNDKELTTTIMAMAERAGADVFCRQQTAIINRIDSRPSLKEIRCPTQVVVGRQDAVSPLEVVREIADGISGARFDIIENCGHLSPLERPEGVNVIMRRWLEGH